MSINQTIQSIYKNNWESLQKNLALLEPSKYTNPFLIAFDETLFKKCDLKVMIFGQETKGWGDKHGMLPKAEDAVAMYDTFFCQKKFYKGYGGSSFWKAFRYFEKHLKKAYPEKEIYFSWNNISKIGKPGTTGVSKDARTVERSNFSVIGAEVKTFAPDIVIFLTGPNRDGDIKHHFSDAEFTAITPNVKKRELAKVSSTDLPERSIRLYHPSYFGGFNRHRKTVVDLIVNES